MYNLPERPAQPIKPQKPSEVPAIERQQRGKQMIEPPVQPSMPRKPSDAPAIDRKEYKRKQLQERPIQLDDKKTEKKLQKQSPPGNVKEQQLSDEIKEEETKQRR